MSRALVMAAAALLCVCGCITWKKRKDKEEEYKRLVTQDECVQGFFLSPPFSLVILVIVSYFRIQGRLFARRHGHILVLGVCKQGTT